MANYTGRNQLIIKVDQPLPSNNDIKRLHWADYNRLKETWLWSMLTHKQPPEVKSYFRKIKIIRHYSVANKKHPQRPFDFDNFIGGMKATIDSLKDLRLIEDDRPDKLSHGQHEQLPDSVKAHGWTEIILEK